MCERFYLRKREWLIYFLSLLLHAVWVKGGMSLRNMIPVEWRQARDYELYIISRQELTGNELCLNPTGVKENRGVLNVLLEYSAILE